MTTTKLDLSAIQFRPADKSECRTIASLYSMSSDGVADYIWTKLAQPGEDILDVGRRRYEQEDSVFSYKNCTVATHGYEVMGMLVAFPIESEETAESSEQDPVLRPSAGLRKIIATISAVWRLCRSTAVWGSAPGS